MNKPGLLLIILLLSCLSSTAQNKNAELFESQLLDSVYQSHQRIGIDLKSELLQFETYLIETKQLPNCSGESYLNVYKQIAESGVFPIQTNYENNKLNKKTYGLFSKGFHSLIRDEEFRRSQSKVMDLQVEFAQLIHSGNISPQTVSEVIVKVLDESDFERELFRMYSLHTFYYLTYFNMDHVDKMKHATFYVTKEQHVFLDGAITAMDRISGKMHDIRTKHKLQETDTCKISLIVDPEVKMGIIVDLKRELKKCGALKIYYSSSK